MVWIIFSFHDSICDAAHFRTAATRHHINNARTLAAFIPSAFQLVCRNCSTLPETAVSISVNSSLFVMITGVVISYPYMDQNLYSIQ